MIGRAESAVRALRRVFSRTTWIVRLFNLSSCPDIPESLKTASAPWSDGLVLVQIDGLSKTSFKKAIDTGRMPFLASLIDKEHYRADSFYSGLPSSTPAVQAELFYGVKTAVPAFGYIDRESGNLHRMYEPDSAREVEQRISGNATPLLLGGSAYCDVYTGGAEDAHFCASSMGWGDVFRGIRPLAWLGVAALYSTVLVRSIVLIGVELFIGLIDVVRGIFAGRAIKAELKFVVSRVAVSILLRDLITIGAKVDIARGLPIIHLNYIGYDEQAHRRGPESAFAHWALKGIDKRIQQLWQASHQARLRHYDVWIYSDHGQESTQPYSRLAGQTIDQAIGQVLDEQGDIENTPHRAIRVQSIGDCIVQKRVHMLGWSKIRRFMPQQAIESFRKESSTALEPDDFVNVIAMGPVGHVYLSEKLHSTVRVAQLAASLVNDHQVPGALYIGADNQLIARVKNRTLLLPADAEQLLGREHPHLQAVTRDLEQLVRHNDAGQLVLLGWVAGSQAISFPTENGAHAGAGPNETNAFLLVPRDALPKVQSDVAYRPCDLRQAALLYLGKADQQGVSPIRKAKLHTQPASTPLSMPQRGGRRLRVMSYNVHSCMGMDGRLAPERIARVIARYQPDVVALQELDVGKHRTRHAHQAMRIAEQLQMECHFHPAMQVDEEEYGDAILTNLPIVRTRKGTLATPLERRGSEPRGVLWLTLDVEGLLVQVFNTHLGLYAAERKQQVDELLSGDWLNHENCTGPVIVCGDFNATPGSSTVQRLWQMLNGRRMGGDNRYQNTFPGRWPCACIDYVLVNGSACVVRTQVPQSELIRLASDHLPVIVDLVLKAEAAD